MAVCFCLPPRAAYLSFSPCLTHTHTHLQSDIYTAQSLYMCMISNVQMCCGHAACHDYSSTLPGYFFKNIKITYK